MEARNNYILKNAHFIKSVMDVAQLPHDGIPQIAFFGKSNVGKSSLINYLTNLKGLAKASGEPGRTKAINIFATTLISQQHGREQQIYLVDLPGFGYAKASKQEKEVMVDLLEQFIGASSELKMIFHLFDCRRSVGEEDSIVSALLQETQKEYRVIATKVDKIKPSEFGAVMISICDGFNISDEHVLAASVMDQSYRQNMLHEISLYI